MKTVSILALLGFVVMTNTTAWAASLAVTPPNPVILPSEPAPVMNREIKDDKSKPESTTRQRVPKKAAHKIAKARAGKAKPASGKKSRS